MPIHYKFQRILLACGMFWVLAIAAGFPMTADAIALSEEVYFTSDQACVLPVHKTGQLKSKGRRLSLSLQ